MEHRVNFHGVGEVQLDHKRIIEDFGDSEGTNVMVIKLD